MSRIVSFFLNALKAIFLSPFYILYFILYLLGAIINYLIGELRLLFSGFKFATKNENIYEKRLYEARMMDQKSGDKQ